MGATVTPGAVTGFLPGKASGAITHDDTAALDEANDTFTSLNGRQGTTIPSELGGTTLTAGVYQQASSAQITGVLTLNGDASSVFIFKIGSTLTTASSSSIVLEGGAMACNVYFLIGRASR